jgi:hypothetical protein
MTAPMTDVVDITVNLSIPNVQAEGYGVGLILATHKHTNPRSKSYASTAEMSADGFASTEEAYKAAAAYFAQEPAPDVVKIGRRSADVVAIDIVAANTFLYSVTINGTAYTFTSDGSATQAEIGAGLVAAIGTNVSGLTPTYATGVLTLTGTTNLAWSLGTLSANLTAQAITATDSISDDLDAIALYDGDFYGMVGTDRSAANQLLVVAWASAAKKLAFVSTQEAGVVDVATGSDTTTLAAVLKAAAYDRACCLYHTGANANYIDAAAMGKVLALKPGSYTLDFKTLIGIVVDSLTSTQRANAAAKYCNIYETRGSAGQVIDGRVSSGKFVDQIHGRDWFSNQLVVNMFAALSSGLKNPFTDAGIGVLEGAAVQAGELGIARGYLESYDTDFPTRDETSAIDRGNRLYTGASMTVYEAGAIHAVEFDLNIQA